MTVVAVVAFGQAQPPDPYYQDLERAYQALRTKDYDLAIAQFQKAITQLPDRPSIRKDLAYTLLKVGENEAARDQFAEAMKLDPADVNVALEYAFLCYETKQQVMRGGFSTNGASRTPRRRKPLKTSTVLCAKASPAGKPCWYPSPIISADMRSWPSWRNSATICRWRLNISKRPGDCVPRGAICWSSLGRVWKQMNAPRGVAWRRCSRRRVRASRALPSRRAICCPTRYPYVYEFEKALALDASNVPLRRELAYLLLQLNQEPQAEAQFQAVIERAP